MTGGYHVVLYWTHDHDHRPPSTRKSCYVERAGLGRVTIFMTAEDAALYVQNAEANGGTGYTIVDQGPFA